MNLTILSKKGGVGKSTLSLLFYEAFRHAGKTVSIHDWDLQGTSTKALELIIIMAANPSSTGTPV